MYKISTLKNGLTLVTVDIPTLKSVTTLVAVGAGSRYETKNINGISHFLEHMFFKGSRKYPTSEMISNLIDGVGAINNAATDKEITFYWIKSATKHLELASDILSSMLSEPLFSEEEIEREKGVITEELRMHKDNPGIYIWNLYEQLQFGNQPLGLEVGGKEEVIGTLKRRDFISYMGSLYSPQNMVLVYAGNVPAHIKEVAQAYFSDLRPRSANTFLPYQKTEQQKPKVHISYKQTDQAHLILGVESFSRLDRRRFALRLLGVILGEGMSSRLFLQVRERRGLAYHVIAFNNPYQDTGFFAVYGGLKLEKVEEALEVIISELERIKTAKVAPDELKKAKEMERGRLALRSESTNFLAEHFGVEYILERELETFDDYMKKIDAVTPEEIQEVARELFQKERYNLQIIAPLKNTTPFLKILQG
ncbi:MAG: pitrilysin family protein [bacterium]|nr:pitrilysin family protein [bacterium]